MSDTTPALFAAAAGDPSALLAHAAELRSTYARPGVAIDNLKMFFDGVIEYPTQTAALLRPYRVNKGTKASRGGRAVRIAGRRTGSPRSQSR